MNLSSGLEVNKVDSARYINYADCSALLALEAGDKAIAREFIEALKGK